MGTKMEGATEQEKQQYRSQLLRLLDRNAMRRQMQMDELDKKLETRFKPTEADLMASYNEVKTRHILIKTENRSDAAAQKLAEEVLAKLKAGGDFVKLAKQYSEDPGTKANGGDLGWVTDQSGFVQEFTEAARKLKKGETSGLVKTMFGYHIMKADDIRSKVPKDIKNPKKKQEYMDSFSERTIAARKQSFNTALRVKAKIEAVDPWVAGYIAENQAISDQNNGRVAESQKMTAEAIKNYELAAKGPMAGDPSLQAKLSELYHATKQEDKALAMLNTLLANNSTPELLMMKGGILEGKKQNAEAIKAYQEASKAVPEMKPWFHLELQQAFIRLGRKDLAQKEYNFWSKFKEADDKKRAASAKGTNIVPVPNPPK
jgi:tetratricopeptide (TPR) repeat protein